MWNDITQWFRDPENAAYVNFTINIGVAVAIITGSWLLFRILMRGAHVYAKTNDMSREVMYLFRRVMRWVFVLVTAGIVLQVVGLLENAWAAITGVLALVAIGFVAVWSVLSNALCSVMLLITRPFAVGDRIRIPAENLEGKVVDFNFMFTRLAAEDGSRIEVPNNLFFQKALVRYEAKDAVRLDDQLMRQGEISDEAPREEKSEEQKAA